MLRALILSLSSIVFFGKLVHLSMKQDITIDACFDTGVTIKIKGQDTNNESFHLLSTSHGSGATFSDLLP